MINILAPARLAVYSGLADHFDLLVLHEGLESNRDTWRDLDKELPNAKVRRARGWQIRRPKKTNDGELFDYHYIHLSPGIIWHLLRFQPSAIITNEMGLRTVIALTYGTIFRKPVWVWWGGTVHTERDIGIVRRILRFVVSHWARRWISYGQSSTEYLLGLKVPVGSIHQTQNGVDERRFGGLADPKFDIQPRPVLLFVGQLIARKGLDLALKAVATLQREGQRLSVLLVGSGPERQSLQQLTRDLRIDNVHFHPSQGPEAMPSVYRSGDVLIFPTLEDVWGLVANEALLSGVPVLCSKYAGCAEELFSPENIFDPENADEFLAKLRLALSGGLPKPDRSRLKSTDEIVNGIIHEIEDSTRGRVRAVLPTQAKEWK
jgi:glycosyltransferase involved in cell wall biosynthesis